MRMHVCVRVSVQWCDAAGVCERVSSLWLFAYVPGSVCRLAGLPLHAPPNWESLKTSLLLWHFGPQHASLAMCDISPGVRGNGKQWPRLPGDAAAVTAEQQHGHFPQYPPYWSARSPPIPFTAVFPFHHLSPLTPCLRPCSISATLSRDPSRAFASLSERLGKIKR